ncbi:MAG TPA: hypothetical protein VK167_09225 [Flavipsychrobacter sp.]|nr:hypothetical protein [Flavipsychrobacter sp.]
MKRFLSILLCVFSFSVNAQLADTSYTLDINGCYIYTLNAFAKGTDGLEKLNKKTLPKNAKEVYISRQYFSAGLPVNAGDLFIHYEDIVGEANKLYTIQQEKRAAFIYMTELSISADTCHLWLIPIILRKNNTEVEVDYPSRGCRLNYQVNRETGKLRYANTVCPPAKKED